MLQSDLYMTLQDRFSRLKGLVFWNRYDEMLAVTNLVSLDAHRQIQEDIASTYPITVSMGVGCGSSPFEAQKNAGLLLRDHGKATGRNGRQMLACDGLVREEEATVQIAHIDVDQYTSQLLSSRSPYETTLAIIDVQQILSKALATKDSPVFFMGGDNFIAVANGLETGYLKATFDRIERELGLKLKCGMGIAPTAREAAKLAASCLSTVRQGNGAGNILCLTTTGKAG